jgi:hypothetical protein
MIGGNSGSGKYGTQIFGIGIFRTAIGIKKDEGHDDMTFIFFI